MSGSCPKGTQSEMVTRLVLSCQGSGTRKKMAAERSLDDDLNCSNSGMANFDEQTPLLINEKG